jgi:hypothetical protein
MSEQETEYRVFGSAIFDNRIWFCIQMGINAASEEEAVKKANTTMMGLSKLNSFVDVEVRTSAGGKPKAYAGVVKGDNPIAMKDADHKYFPAHARYFFVYKTMLGDQEIEIQSNSVPDDELGSFEMVQELMSEATNFERQGTGDFEIWNQEEADAWSKAYDEGVEKGLWKDYIRLRDDDLPF